MSRVPNKHKQPSEISGARTTRLAPDDVRQPQPTWADSWTGSRSPPVVLAVVGVALLMAGAALGIAVAGEKTLPGEIDTMLATQRPVSSHIDAIAWWASRAGDALPALLLVSSLAAALCVFRGRVDLALFILAATALRGIGPILKWIFASSRPPADLIAIFEHADGFGYPSGHALGAALVYGAIAVGIPPILPYPLAGWAVRILAVVVMILVAISRVRLGVHWPSDVIGGLAFGMGIICLLQALIAHRRLQVRT